MTAKTFERFLRYNTGMGYIDIYNLCTMEEGEKILKEQFKKWIEIENPSNSWQIIAKLNISQLGYEI